MNIEELESFAQFVRNSDDRVAVQKEREERQYKKFSILLDYIDENKDMIPSLVKFVFDNTKDKKLAVEIVSYLHDETLDLTTIPESAPYFKKW